ncbi:hypothetical protein H8B19_09500 [Neptunicella marina]|uniref:Uncharacterized protein n=2 Tax=Neptunicella marina TaxID=2125989 RepID=A0A8J6LZG6_9ALTE|nr:hypothetical protein [Neptunicella marina]
MSTLMSSSADAVIYEVYGLRAHNAARVGLERRLEAIFSSRPADATACINETFSFDSVTGLKNCQAVTSCSSQAYNLDDGNASAFYFSSTGRCDGGQVTVSRTIKVDALERQ